MGIWLVSKETSGNWSWHSLSLSHKMLRAPNSQMHCGAQGRRTQSRQSTWCWAWPLWATHATGCMRRWRSPELWAWEGFYFCSNAYTMCYVNYLTNMCPPPPLDWQPWEGRTTWTCSPLCSHSLALNRYSVNTCWEKQMTHHNFMASLWAVKSFWNVNGHSLNLSEVHFSGMIDVTGIHLPLCVIVSIPCVNECYLMTIGIMG